MARDGSITKNKIIDTAMNLALQQGHVATSVDEIIDSAEITKGTFFYHFSSKNDLAKSLIEKFSENEIEILDKNLEKASKLSKDPLQQLLIFVGLIQELHEQIDTIHIGCLFASYSYENLLNDKKLLKYATNTLNEWKINLSKKIKEIINKYPPRNSVNPDELADMFLATLEGAYVLARVLNRPEIIQTNLEQYKIYLEVLFSGD